MALDWRLSPCGWWDVEPPIRPRASYQCPGGAKGERAGTQPETELEFPTVMCLCGWSRRKQHLPGTSCPGGQGGAWPGPPRPRMAAVLTRISTGNTSESSPCALLPTLAARGRPGALQEAPLSVEVCGSCESRALMSSAREKPSRKDYSEVLEVRGLVRLFAVQRCSQLTAWSCLRAVAELQGCICPSSMQELWAPPHQLCQQQHVHMDTHTVLETNSSSSILAGYILQPLQLLLFAAAFLFLPSIQKRKRSYVWYKKKKNHFIILDPSGHTITKQCLAKRELLHHSRAQLLQKGPKHSLLPTISASMLQEWARQENRALTPSIPAVCQTCRNNSCCHQPSIFLGFDITHGDKSGDGSFEPSEHGSSLWRHGALLVPMGAVWRRAAELKAVLKKESKIPTDFPHPLSVFSRTKWFLHPSLPKCLLYIRLLHYVLPRMHFGLQLLVLGLLSFLIFSGYGYFGSKHWWQLWKKHCSFVMCSKRGLLSSEWCNSVQNINCTIGRLPAQLFTAPLSAADSDLTPVGELLDSLPWGPFLPTQIVQHNERFLFQRPNGALLSSGETWNGLGWSSVPCHWSLSA